jgi:hypothetical protein
MKLLTGEDDRFLSDYKTIKKVIDAVRQPYADHNLVLNAIKSAKWKLLSDGQIINNAYPPKKCSYKTKATLRDKAYAIYKKQAWAKAQVMKQLPDTCMTVQFSHIMAGGYAAGYYSYKWAEVLDADAFSVFKKNGIFDKKTAQSFRDNILSKGGTEHPMTLYKRFRGQEPTIRALLTRNGINTAQ